MTDRPIKLFTLCFIREGERVLLGMKKRGFGEGKWNGFGGKVDPGETIEEAARREIFEEAGITVMEMERRAQFDFESESDPTILRVSVYAITDYSGEPVETEEMEPAWHAIDKIPFDRMWKDDIYWLPRFLNGETLSGTFLFDDLEDPDAELLEFTLEAV